MLYPANRPRYHWLTEVSEKFLSHDDLLLGLTAPERVRVIADTAESLLKKPGFADKFEDYVSRGWFSLASPIWSNMGLQRGLPISCFCSYVGDSREEICQAQAEVSMMTSLGGGTAGYFGDVRGRGEPITNNGTSHGSVHFMQLFETLIKIWSQGNTRKGQFAAYLPIDHPDIEEFLTLHDKDSPIQKLSFGVCIDDYWMNKMIMGDTKCRTLWGKVLAKREQGFPYLFFTDNANRGAPLWYREQNYEILCSQLCSEIFLPISTLESFVCCVSSLNMLYYDEWKNTDAVETMVYFLDAVLTEFIEKAKHIRFMERAVRFAERHRAIGIGWFGWHSLLESKMIPFESMEAKILNTEIAKTMHRQSWDASAKMAREYGEPDVTKGYGQRHATRLAIAPTKSSSFIIGQASEGIEPHESNVTVKDLEKVKHTVRNPHLLELLKSKGRNDAATWHEITNAGGSVQKMSFLSQHEKDVFKTFGEISQKEVVIQAAARQKYIDQGQSLNLMIHPSIPVKDVNALYIEGWKSGIKSFYYQKSVNAAQEFSRNILACKSCES
jgi:ribonucleoside-diphosphate reductase alpha chain